MVMSQGTYTFLACFAGFWLVWALIVMLCCFCSFLQRRLKRRGQERLREQCLRALEMEPLDGGVARGYPPSALPGVREAPQFCPPQTLLPPASVPLHVPPHTLLPQGNWTGMPEPDIFGKPPCYEEAVLMEDPPPPYSEVLSDHRGGPQGITCTKPPPTRAPPPRADLQELHQVETTGKPPPATVLPERAYSSLIRLPTARRWDSLGRLLSTMDLNHNTLGPPSDALQGAAPGVGTMPRQGRRSHPELGVGAFRGLGGGLEQDGGGGGLPTAFPLLGRSTAV